MRFGKTGLLLMRADIGFCLLVRVVIFTVIPAQAGIYTCRLHYRSRRLRRWILAKAGIYALRWTPVFAVATDPHLNPLIRKHCFSDVPVIPTFRFFRHSGLRRNLVSVAICTVIPAPPTVIPAQAGIYALRLDSGFRRNDGPIAGQRPQFPRPRGNHQCRPRPDALTGRAPQC